MRGHKLRHSMLIGGLYSGHSFLIHLVRAIDVSRFFFFHFAVGFHVRFSVRTKNAIAYAQMLTSDRLIVVAICGGMNHTWGYLFGMNLGKIRMEFSLGSTHVCGHRGFHFPRDVFVSVPY